MNTFQIKKYISFRLAAKKGGHGIHSPFVFDFINNVIDNTGVFYDFDKIEEIRKELLRNNNTIKINDLGAGSKKHSSEKRKISDIAKYSLKSAKQASFLMRIANYINAENIIEIGTSLGITTMYLSLLKQAKITTIEGDENIFKIANSNFKKLKIENINNICANFDDILPEIINKTTTIDLAFIDGNHTKEATLKYFELLKQKVHKNSVLVFDDIYWSKDMGEAWEIIKKDSKVVVSIDLFHLGLVFFKQEMPKQDFYIFSKNI